ncbi:MAG: YidC/Oxa1 family membrane protein insertase [Acidimicrobiales bacterium]
MIMAVLMASTIGQIFQPLFRAMAWLLAFFYALAPNYAIAIALLTVAVMVVTAPLTIKSTRSMVAMQQFAPEMKKLQQKYKGDRAQLNEEMMKLYREHNINPAGGCLPMIIQIPVFIILYDSIRGLTHTFTSHGHVIPAPLYIGHSTRIYHDLLHSAGKMMAFGINLTQTVLGHHSSISSAIPYWVLFGAAILLQYIQINQINRRNPQLAQTNPQAQMMQKYMPFLFAIFYLYFPAGVVVYFIVSSLCRIAIQEGLFRFGMFSTPAVAAESIPRSDVGSSGGRPRRPTLMERLANAQAKAAGQQRAQQPRSGGARSGTRQTRQLGTGGSSSNGAGRPAGTKPSTGKPSTQKPAAQAQKPTPGRPAGTKPSTGKPSTQKPAAQAQKPTPDDADTKKPHPRARSKRERKAP